MENSEIGDKSAALPAENKEIIEKYAKLNQFNRKTIEDLLTSLLARQ